MVKAIKKQLGLSNDINSVISRFPIPVALMGIMTVVMMFRNYLGDHEQLAYLCGGFIFAGYLLVSWTIGREGQGKAQYLFIQIIFAVFIALLAWHSKKIYFQLPLAIIGSILLLGNSVRWRRSRDDLHIWEFTHKLWTGAGFAVIGSLIFVIGLFSIRFALKTLFGLEISSLVDYFLMPIGLAFLAPLYWMFTLPRVDESYQDLYDNPGFVSKAIAFLGTWVLTPLLLIYALIILVYGVKIVLSWSLPQGEIVGLTGPFLIIGTLNWLVLEPPFIQQRWLAKFFRHIWFWLSIPVTILLIIAILIRIFEYGLTLQRIIVFLGAVATLGNGFWFSLAPQRFRDIRIIPASVAGLAVLAAVFASYISIRHQESRFVNYMQQTGLVENGVFKATAQIDNFTAARKAKGALKYLAKHHENKRIEKHFKDWDIEITSKKSSEIYINQLGLSDVEDSNGFYNRASSPINHTWNNSTVINIAEYNYILGTYDINSNRKVTGFEDITIKIDNQSLFLLGVDDAVISEFNMNVWIKTLPVDNNILLVDNQLINIYENGDQKIVIWVTSLNLWGDETGGDFLVLAKGFKPNP